MNEDYKELGMRLKEKGLTCPKLERMIKKQKRDALSDKKDAQLFESLGFHNEAKRQIDLANKQIESSNALSSLKNKVCRKL